MYRIAGNFCGRKPLQISRTREHLRNFYSRKVKKDALHYGSGEVKHTEWSHVAHYSVCRR